MHIHETMHSHKYTAARKKPSHSNTRLLVSTVPVSFITVSSYYTNWINSSYSQQSELLPIVCLLFTWRIQTRSFLPLYSITRQGDPRKTTWHISVDMQRLPNIWYHTLLQREQMSHQAVPLVLKSILAHRRSVSCPVCVVHLNRHVRKYVMWKVCLLKCASLIMVFPFISVPPPSSPSLHHPLMKTVPLWGGMLCH